MLTTLNFQGGTMQLQSLFPNPSAPSFTHKHSPHLLFFSEIQFSGPLSILSSTKFVPATQSRLIILQQDHEIQSSPCQFKHMKFPNSFYNGHSHSIPLFNYLRNNPLPKYFIPLQFKFNTYIDFNKLYFPPNMKSNYLIISV